MLCCAKQRRSRYQRRCCRHAPKPPRPHRPSRRRRAVCPRSSLQARALPAAASATTRIHSAGCCCTAHVLHGSRCFLATAAVMGQLHWLGIQPGIDVRLQQATAARRRLQQRPCRGDGGSTRRDASTFCTCVLQPLSIRAEQSRDRIHNDDMCCMAASIAHHVLMSLRL